MVSGDVWPKWYQAMTYRLHNAKLLPLLMLINYSLDPQEHRSSILIYTLTSMVLYSNYHWRYNISILIISWASYQLRKIAGCACAGNAGNVFPATQLQRKPLVSDPDMHHGTCVTHVPCCISGSPTRGDGGNVPGIPGACATRNFTYLARGPCNSLCRCNYPCLIVGTSLYNHFSIWNPWYVRHQISFGSDVGVSLITRHGTRCIENVFKICVLPYNSMLL